MKQTLFPHLGKKNNNTQLVVYFQIISQTGKLRLNGLIRSQKQQKNKDTQQPRTFDSPPSPFSAAICFSLPMAQAVK